MFPVMLVPAQAQSSEGVGADRLGARKTPGVQGPWSLGSLR